MKLHQLNNQTRRKARKRVGRGDSSGHGRTAGRGDKGARARAGFVRRPFFEGGQIPLYRRLPKRGFKNPNHVVYTVINVGYLDEHFGASSEVSQLALEQCGAIGRKDNMGLKILGDGELTKPLTVKANKFSASARRKIEAAGGVCEVV